MGRRGGRSITEKQVVPIKTIPVVHRLLISYNFSMDHFSLKWNDLWDVNDPRKRLASGGIPVECKSSVDAIEAAEITRIVPTAIPTVL